jgi:hypothetical protein
MISHYFLDGLPLVTGDLIFTTDGHAHYLPGEVWRLFGRLVPGPIDHVAMYVGPGGRCVESGPLGVVVYEAPDGHWNVQCMLRQRSWLVDTLFGVGDPLAGRGFSPEEEQRIRVAAAAYCLAQVGKPYNVNFFNPHTQKSFYCSQLIYLAYLGQGIDLNTNCIADALPGTEVWIYPEEIWEACAHRRQAVSLSL